ncbi:S46 family peptidase [Sphingobacterium cellulitidis]|uniref:Dipeptidyl-peptidase n=1 Tax=Sphingobacterium cellulitidis TaxID=1768011 RepID=A0A8H9G303_9SPHI|nr:S46 family peptidase [Sphingobacterium soli]MBA8986699.1 V8-like Glu-specific endopeptidase [Sphingobacterium soli]GGE27180.1 dipeptidyl peptidase S46 family protein [Sphingobacterium soli]
MLNFIKAGLIAAFLTTGTIIIPNAIPDEGMFPLSELSKAGLKKAGLKISEKEIYNPGQIGLVDALVQVSGCSGSFVSPNGLIITNHHCAFSAVQLASTPEHNYLENGFVANSHEQEIEAKGLNIRITDSYQDVSQRILEAVSNVSDPSQRIDIINNKRQEIAKEAEAQDPTIKAEVSEMFIGKSYVLFRYKTIEDVRLVYVPRQNIGEFGGETDNWVWPRHTGDFSFLRAYVAKDGSSAKYSKDNVPYKPKKHLKVNPNGVKENDFVFILGYPGRTFRHRPAQYIEYQQQYLLPYTSELYDFQNQQMLLAGKDDKATELALATRIKRNANVMKNYRGKLKGLRNIDLINSKIKEDEELAKFIENDAELKSKYGSLMEDIDQHYKQVFNNAEKELWYNNIYSGIRSLQFASLTNSFQEALNKELSSSRKAELFNANIANFKKQLAGLYESFNINVDKSIASNMFAQAYQLKDGNSLPFVAAHKFNNAQAASDYISRIIEDSKLSNQEYFENTVLKDANSFLKYSDELMKFQKELDSEMQPFYAEQKRREGNLNKLMADYMAVKEKFQSKSFIPDANSTLRLTFGNIKGYSPADANYMAPFTTVKGIIEKGNSGLPEFEYPEAIKTNWLDKNFGNYFNKDLNDVPVNILYNMDTTGGNSGSPIMNAYGELIGVNFDRAYDATINDFAWNESYSRSIGVDIRYVLWIADKIDNAQFIIQEMGVK